MKVLARVYETVVCIIAIPFIWLAWKLHGPGGEMGDFDEDEL